METVVDQDVVVDGVRIAYRDGEGDGRPVVLVRGTPSHSYIWRHRALSRVPQEGDLRGR
jgi:pimeloyl-ACP methyl ester carboxylesterase